MRTEPMVESFPGACTYWDYVASTPSLRTRARRIIQQWQRDPAPAAMTLKPPLGRARWVLYFVFLPDGKLTETHRFTLERLAKENVQIMVICACPASHSVLDELSPLCQALCWKEPKGWDFCAYAMGLTLLAKRAAGSDVLVLNDSVFGPFSPVVPFMEAAPWRLTGFTGNNQSEHHIQSYAFIIKSIDNDFLEHLAGILNTQFYYRNQQGVVLCQETQMARKAAKRYAVGSFWFTTSIESTDLCLGWPVQLVDAGFPFVKRSLVGKFANAFNQATEIQALLYRLGHPEGPTTIPTILEQR
jgi:lipopolysaccharide biosynthesis protein